MKGWFRLSDRRRWHAFSAMATNAFLLVPGCGRPLMLGAQHADRLKKTSELPPGAQICSGCAASVGMDA